MAKARGNHNRPAWCYLVQALGGGEGQGRGGLLSHRRIKAANIPTGRTWRAEVKGAQTVDALAQIL
jgi:hypothetical protein